MPVGAGYYIGFPISNTKLGMNNCTNTFWDLGFIWASSGVPFWTTFGVQNLMCFFGSAWVHFLEMIWVPDLAVPAVEVHLSLHAVKTNFHILRLGYYINIWKW